MGTTAWDKDVAGLSWCAVPSKQAFALIWVGWVNPMGGCHEELDSRRGFRDGVSDKKWHGDEGVGPKC